MAPHVLLYSRTTAYRHESIPDGIKAFTELGEQHGFTVEATELPAAFEGQELGRYSAVVFLSTSGDVLTDEGRANLASYHRNGGGFMGVHAAACTEYDWPYYGTLLGARFARHPPLQPGTLVVEDTGHPATGHLPRRWDLIDEWYDFRTNPRSGVRVLATVDEHSYEGGGMPDDHPVMWCHANGGGPVFYTALGHTGDAFRDPLFRSHLWGGLESVME
ncbi:ThuA domain-containing protein [Streptomyces sp. NPDC079167]|uniref:ThuA domain-containing protein n=1 Tax=Streptomyces sp. NPDC079167 TaxID=3154513 RepID=UPI00344A976E